MISIRGMKDMHLYIMRRLSLWQEYSRVAEDSLFMTFGQSYLTHEVPENVGMLSTTPVMYEGCRSNSS